MPSADISPLRYPGGKGSLTPFFRQLLSAQTQPAEVFVEPFAGGAGVSLRLLVEGRVERIVLNDLDAGIAAFWRSVFHSTEELATLIENAEVAIDNWHRQRAIRAKAKDSVDDLALGFATFFLNRTNRSGILGARPIGGLAQAGKWKLDARFNKPALAARVRALGAFRDRVTIAEQNGATLVAGFLSPGAFIYADPPYLTQGADLYLDAMTWADHAKLAANLARSRGLWMVTYDHDARVGELYPAFRRAEFAIAHTAARPHIGKEYAVFSDRVTVPALNGLGHEPAFVA
jgi:DNA adenine methylase